MGVYWDIVCQKHKEVIQLWRLYNISDDVWRYTYSGLEQREQNINDFIIVDSKIRGLLRKVNDNVINHYLDKHKDCDLLLGSDAQEMSSWFDYYDGWLEYDIQEELKEGINPKICTNEE